MDCSENVKGSDVVTLHVREEFSEVAKDGIAPDQEVRGIRVGQEDSGLGRPDGGEGVPSEAVKGNEKRMTGGQRGGGIGPCTGPLGMEAWL
jgi:hypothetical protein